MDNDYVMRAVTLTGVLSNGRKLDHINVCLGMSLDDMVIQLGTPDNYMEDSDANEITLVYDINTDSYLFSFAMRGTESGRLINTWATGGY